MDVSLRTVHCVRDLSGVKPVRIEAQYERAEKAGMASMLTADGQMNYTMLNSVGLEILDLCDGKRSVEEIGALLQSHYPDVELATIERDLIATLKELTKLYLILWVAADGDIAVDDPFGRLSERTVCSGGVLVLAGEGRLRALEGYLRSLQIEGKKALEYLNPLHDDIMQVLSNPLSIRHDLFSYEKDYFLLLNECDLASIKGIVIVKPHRNPKISRASIVLSTIRATAFGDVLDNIADFYSHAPGRRIASLEMPFTDGQKRELGEMYKAAVAHRFRTESTCRSLYNGSEDIDVLVRW